MQLNKMSESGTQSSPPKRDIAEDKSHRQIRRLARLTPKVIAERLAPRGIKMISEYNTAGRLATFECQHGHIWRVTAGSVINSKSGCPHCANELYRAKLKELKK